VIPSALRHRWLLALVCGCTLVGHAAAATTPTDPWAQIGSVRAPGGPFLRDAHGRRLQLHGVDLAAKCGGGARPLKGSGTPCVGPASGPHLAFVLSPTARDPGRRFTAANARTLHQLGFTIVRLGIVWQGLEPGPRDAGPNDPRYCARHRAGTPFPTLGAADPYRASVVSAYLARTDRIVALLAHAGLRVIIDMHQDVYGSAFSDPRGPSPWNGERRGSPALGHLHRRAALRREPVLGLCLRRHAGTDGHPPLLARRRAGRPAGPVRAGLASGRAPLP
jgi:hypothetical protein